jgi:hypothetical protein
MPSVPSAEESAGGILAIFKVMGFRSGAILQRDQVQMQFTVNGGNTAEFGVGLQFGVDNGWLKSPSATTIELTDTGFAECGKTEESNEVASDSPAFSTPHLSK